MRKAIIGGTGVYNVSNPENVKIQTRDIGTMYGVVSVDILEEERGELVFLARHGKKHNVPPHLINYRANMIALKQLEVDEIYSTCAVGSMNKAFGIGDVVIIKDFIDFTKSGPATYYEGEGGVKHVDMTNPYCPHLSRSFENNAELYDINLKGYAVYVCTEGPRFETAAEIQMFRMLGGDVVGMTNVPECVLAKELGICYSAIGIVSNWCTGIEKEEMIIHNIEVAIETNKERITKAFVNILLREPDKKVCRCSRSLISI